MVGDNTRKFNLERLFVAKCGSPTIASIITSANGGVGGSSEIKAGSLLLLQVTGDGGWFQFTELNRWPGWKRPSQTDGIKLKPDELYYFTLGSQQNQVMFESPNPGAATLRVWVLL